MKREMEHREDGIKLRCWGVCVGLCALSAAGFLAAGQWLSGLICLGTVILVSLPMLLEQVGHWKLSRGFFIFCLLYAMGPMLGKSFKLYYLTNWWDKLLHTSAGFVFAVLGVCLAAALNRGNPPSPAMQVIFGICFSITVSALWELVEFGMDWIFDMDMQNDTVVHAIHSYLLSDAPGVLTDITDIRTVQLDGAALEIGGYLDIGLIDTMCDVLVETLGAAVYGLWHLWDRDRHPLVRMPRSVET